MIRIIALLDIFYILHFVNKYLVNRYQITTEELKSLIIYALTLIILISLISIIFNRFVTADLKLLIIINLFFYLCLNYSKLTIYFYFNNINFIKNIPNYAFVSFVLFFTICSFLLMKIDAEKILKPLIVFNLITILLTNFQFTFTNEDSSISKEELSYKYQLLKKPDIYYIVFDGYPNLDVAQELYDYNSENIRLIFQNNNITINSLSTSPYGRTTYTFASIFEGKYLFNPPEVSFADRKKILENYKSGNTFIENILRENGYNIFKYGNKTYCSDTDICINELVKNINTNNSVVYDLMMETPLKVVIEKGWISFNDIFKLSCNTSCEFNRSKDEKFESLFNVVNENTNSPKFVFFHLMNTHEPFVFDENCEYLINPSYLSAKDNKQGFFSTLNCANNEINYLINTINLKNTILIIQSDHGPNFEEQVSSSNDLANNQLKSRYFTLSVSNYNDYCQKEEKISGVNTFRALIECLSGKSIIRAEEKNYLIYGSSEPSIFNITEEVKATIKP